MSKIYTDDQKNQIVFLRKDGYTYNEIAKILSINNLTTISNICADNGLQMKSYPNKTKYKIGDLFHNYILIEKTKKITKNNTSHPAWKVKCNCGKIFIITVKQIKRGQKSCGCHSKTSILHIHNTKDVIGTTRFNHYQSGAKKRNLKWELSKDIFINLLFGNCFYCGSLPATLVKMNKHEQLVNGVDRVDNNIGYLESNCVSCCAFCNRAKGNMTIEDFKTWISNIKLKK